MGRPILYLLDTLWQIFYCFNHSDRVTINGVDTDDSMTELQDQLELLDLTMATLVYFASRW